MIPYKYVRKHLMIELAIIVFLASLMSSYVLLTAEGARSAPSYIAGASNNTIIMYNSGSKAIFTGLVPQALADQVKRVKGVEAVSPEILIPVVIDGNSTVFIRGIIPSRFIELNQIKRINGSWLNSSSLFEAVAGASVADKLGIGIGDLIVASSPFNGRSFALKIIGICSLGEPFDSELIVPLRTGQMLRGTYNAVSFIRVKISSPSTFSELSKAFNVKTASTGSLAGLPSWILKFIASGKLGIGRGTSLIRSYSDAYGLSRSSITALTLIIAVSALVAVYAASLSIVASLRDEISTLKSLGASSETIWLDLSMRGGLISLISSIGGVLVALPLISGLRLSFLMHPISPSYDPYVASAIIASTVVTVVIALGIGIKGVEPVEG